MEANWKQTGKGTWSAVENERGADGKVVWTATIRQRKAGQETVYNWTVTATRKGTFSGIASKLGDAKEAALAAVEAHILPKREAEEQPETEA